MDFLKLVQSRYSVRAYTADPVPDALLQQVLEAAQMAPTAANRQPFQLLVIHIAQRREELKPLYPREWVWQAPLLIGVCAWPAQAWIRNSDRKNYSDVDAAIVMDHIVYAAADAGLGTCWIAAFDPLAARSLFHLPADVEPIAFTPLGYPLDTPKPKQRRALKDLVRYERWD